MLLFNTRWWNQILMLNGILLNAMVISLFIGNGSCINADAASTSATDACLKSCSKRTSYDRSLQKVLNRKKRYLVYPPGSGVGATLSLVKSMVWTTPRGYNYLAEVDFLYPLPDTPRFPKKKPPLPLPIKPPPPPPMKPLKLYPVDHHYPSYEHDHGVPASYWSQPHPEQIWAPASGWKNDIIPNLSSPNIPPLAQKKIWSNSNWNENVNFQNVIKDPKMAVTPGYYNKIKSRRKYDYAQNEAGKWQKLPKKQVHEYNAWKQPIWNHMPVENKNTYYLPRGRAMRSTDIQRNLTTFNEKDHEDWEHLHNHRDRRDLYSLLEIALTLRKGIDARACIGRTICEVQHLLMPPGKSMFYDMFRTVFTIPIKDNMKDDYSNAMRNTNEEDCWKIYEENCPISILDMVTQTKKI